MSKCKEYQVNSEIVKCLEENEITKHSKICLEEQKLKKQYPSAKEIIWLPEKQNWLINFNYLDKDHQAKVEKSKKKPEEVVEILEDEDE